MYKYIIALSFLASSASAQIGTGGTGFGKNVEANVEQGTYTITGPWTFASDALFSSSVTGSAFFGNGFGLTGISGASMLDASITTNKLDSASVTTQKLHPEALSPLFIGGGKIGINNNNPVFGVHISSALMLLDGAGNNIFLNQGSIGIQLESGVAGSLTVRRSEPTSATLGADIFLVRRRGTQAAPLALLTGDIMGVLSMRGYGTGEATGAVIRGEAASNWSGSDRGTNIAFLTAPIGGTALGRAMIITSEKLVGIGTSVPARRLHISDYARMEPVSAPPGSASMGDIYVDSDSGELCFYDGAAWQGISSLIDANCS